MKTFFKLSGLLLLLLFVVSCSSTMNAVWKKQNYNVRPYKKLAVVAISKNLEARQSIEASIISEIRKSNPTLELVSGLSLLPPNINSKNWGEKEFEALLKKHNIDAVLTTSMIDNYTTEDVSQTNSMYYPRYYRVGRYVYRTYDYMYSSPTYETSENFVLQSNLFDLQEGNKKEDVLVWQGQSNVINPSSISSAAKTYSKKLIDYFTENRFL